MGDICSICGGFTECIIGSYYQCPKCEKGKSSTSTSVSVAKSTDLIVYVYKKRGPTPIFKGDERSFWATDYGAANLRIEGEYLGFRVVGKHKVKDCSGYSRDVAFYIEALEDVTFEAC